MDKLEVTFAFAIGQLVFHKAGRGNPSHTPHKGIVTAQVAERCHGGCIQIAYITSPPLNDRNAMTPECCLTAEEPEYIPEWRRVVNEVKKDEQAK